MTETRPNPTDPADDAYEGSGALDALAEEHARLLAELGAETRAERRAKRIVPWIAAIALHAALIAIGFVVTWSVVSVSREDEPILVIADFESLIFDPIATLELESLAEEQALEPELDLLPLDLPFEELMPSFDPEIVPALPEAPRGSHEIDFSPAPARGSASFMGLTTTNARRVVYVIDASGSMVAYLPFIVSELTRSLDALTEEQSFAIVFYQGDAALPFPPRGLAVASVAEKDRALRWIDAEIRPRRVSNPIPAFEHAARVNPDVIFLLSGNITSTGQFEVDQTELLARLDQLNPVDRVAGHRPIQINCIQFLDEDPLETMRIIAERHGGERGYRFISRRDLGI